MSGTQRALKAVQLIRRPIFLRGLGRHGVAAAVEHLDAIRWCDAATLIDIGANKGQFSLAYRALKPHGRIIAFEPFPESGDRFLRLFGTDDKVELHRVALAETASVAKFHVTTRRDSSSLLAPGKAQSAAFDVYGETVIDVNVARLDSIVDLGTLDGPVMVKIDVQGAELKVLEGCVNLEKADYLYIELSYVILYDGQPLFDEVASYLFSRGFAVAGIYNQTVTKRFGPTQTDVLFKRRDD